MLLPDLRREVLEANLELVRKGLVLLTFGNASGISREKGLVVIKPSGVAYERMKPGHLVVTDLNGKIVEGKLRPSSDLPTHLVLYKSFAKIGGVSHTLRVTRIRNMRRRGRKRGVPFLALAPPMLILFTGPFRSPPNSKIRRFPKVMKRIQGTPLCAPFGILTTPRFRQCWWQIMPPSPGGRIREHPRTTR